MKKEEILPIGTIIKLKKGEKKIMIISRGALYNDNGKMGYFEYSGCYYPQGQNTVTAIYFNNADIEETIFKGYEDEEEKEYLNVYLETIRNTNYPQMYISKEEKKKDRL